MDGSAQRRGATANATGTATPATTGMHFLQLPGPTNIPERVLRAMHRTAIDQRSAEFGAFAKGLFHDLGRVFRTDDEIFIFPASGSGAGEAAIANTLSAGDGILMFDSGMFSVLWIKMATQFGLNVHTLENDWRRGPDPEAIEHFLRQDTNHDVKAVLVVHNETSTGVTSRIPEIRKAIDAAGHPALLIVDTISSLGSLDYRHDEWGVDVSIGGSQKGLMMPPGLSFNAVSAKARKAAETATLPKFYWDWEWMRSMNGDGFFPYTPAIQMFYGLREALDMLFEEGLDNIIARHTRHGEATRAAVAAWGLEIVCADPREVSNSVTAVFVPEGADADAFRSGVLEDFNMALGGGLQRLAGRVFRIGHMGSFNDIMLMGVLAGVELGLLKSGIQHRPDGIAAARDRISSAT